MRELLARWLGRPEFRVDYGDGVSIRMPASEADTYAKVFGGKVFWDPARHGLEKWRD